MAYALLYLHCGVADFVSHWSGRLHFWYYRGSVLNPAAPTVLLYVALPSYIPTKNLKKVASVPNSLVILAYIIDPAVWPWVLPSVGYYSRRLTSGFMQY